MVICLLVAPVQMVVMNIADSQAAYASKVCALLQYAGIKVNLDLRNEVALKSANIQWRVFRTS